MDELQARISAEVAALEGLDLEGLRTEWRRRLGPPPALRSVELLRLQLAWRIQAAAFGGLDAKTRLMLRRPAIMRAGSLCQPGDRLVREWEGVRHEVTATDEGFIHAGRTFDSLSAVARAITGVRWNGPRFFGLRQTEKAG